MNGSYSIYARILKPVLWCGVGFMTLSSALHQAHSQGFSIDYGGHTHEIASSGQAYHEPLKSPERDPYGGYGESRVSSSSRPHTQTDATTHKSFNIDGSRPDALTTQEDVNRAGEKGCFLLHQSDRSRPDDNQLRAFCHNAFRNTVAPVAELHPLLNHANDGMQEESGNYKPHFSIGKVTVTDNIRDNHPTLEEKPDGKATFTAGERVPKSPLVTHHTHDEALNNTGLTEKIDRSCDLTRDLRVMLSPRCLKGAVNGEGEREERKADGTKRETSGKSSGPPSGKYLCHISFRPGVHRGFVQGYVATPDTCTKRAYFLSGVMGLRVFDRMGYVVLQKRM